jgi:hypothetical protein
VDRRDGEAATAEERFGKHFRNARAGSVSRKAFCCGLAGGDTELHIDAMRH